MVDQIIEFSDHRIDRLAIIAWRKETRRIPPQWDRIEFLVEECKANPMAAIDRWIAANLDGRWGGYAVAIRPGTYRVILAFADEYAAVMFRLSGGDTAWTEI